MPRRELPLLDRPDPAALPLVERVRFYLQQIDDYHANPTGGLLEITQIGLVLAEVLVVLTAREL